VELCGSVFVKGTAAIRRKPAAHDGRREPLNRVDCVEKLAV
jgi:hypothetical protein